MKNNKLAVGLCAQQEPSTLIFCAGIGTTTWALKKEGFNVVGAIDKWDYARSIYKLNFPGTMFIEKSVRALTPSAIKDEIGLGKNDDLDMIQISNPCTGVSTSGKRDIFSAVNDLFFVCTKLAFALKPKVILYENVTGLTNSGATTLFAMVKNFIEREGSNYHIEAKVLNAYLHGDPQARERIFIQCVRKDVGVPVWPEPIPEGERQVIGDVLSNVEYLANKDFGYRLYTSIEPAPTVTGHAQMIVHDGEKERSLKPREYARLMGLPDEFKLEGAKDDQILGIGNGVCVGVMGRIASAVKPMILNNVKPTAPAA